jgi:hypothetical protein
MGKAAGIKRLDEQPFNSALPAKNDLFVAEP